MNPIEKLIDAVEEMLKYHMNIVDMRTTVDSAKEYLTNLPKPLPSRERMIEIINNSKDQTPGGLADAILHDGQIKIGDGWVDPKSDTVVYKVEDCLGRVYEQKASWFTYANPHHYYFLSRYNAEAFRAAELAKLHEDEVQIGNGKWVKKGTTGLCQSQGEQRVAEVGVFKALFPVEIYDDKTRLFLTESEAEDQLHKDGFVKVADGWVKPKTKVWFVGKCGITVIDNLRIEEAKSFTKNCYQSIDNAIEAFRKLAKETK